MPKQKEIGGRRSEDLYWLEVKGGSGAVVAVNGIIIDSSPSLKKSFVGKKIVDMMKMYRINKLGD